MGILLMLRNRKLYDGFLFLWMLTFDSASRFFLECYEAIVCARFLIFVPLK
ncbi:hypothetical protein [Cohnella phaseoli]|uniref:hypothetical protein n=1 Tax=Cohnella phaseoli TaxID=456490 RepID=UPI003CCC6EA8